MYYNFVKTYASSAPSETRQTLILSSEPRVVSTPAVQRLLSFPAPDHVVQMQKVTEHVLCDCQFDDTQIHVEVLHTTRAARGERSSSSMSPFLKLLCTYVYILNRFNRRSRVHVLLALFDVPRTLYNPDQHSSVGPEHVNAGVTYLADAISIVYRREDWQKVLLHELLHMYDFDFYRGDHAWEQRLAQPFQIRSSGGSLGMNEGFNEGIAALMYMCLHVLRRSRRRMTKPQYIQKFNVLRRDYTKRFCKTAAWLHHTCREGSSSSSRGGGGMLYERTHVFSYYFVKAALFVQFEAFMAFCGRDVRIGEGNASRIRQFYTLVEACLASSSFKSLIDKPPTVRGAYSLRLMYGLRV